MDCLVRKNTPYRRAEFERRQRITIEDIRKYAAEQGIAKDALQKGMEENPASLRKKARSYPARCDYKC